jgi:site-specific DNA-methyltransferase (adenine-specific)
MITLINDDCLKAMDKLIADGVVVDAIITDPPYNTTACHWDKLIPFNEMWLRLNKLIKPNGAIVLFGSEPFSSALRMSNIKNYKYDWKWDKVVGSNFVNARRMPLKVYEDVVVFYKRQPTYNPQMVLREKRNFRVSGESRNISNRVNGVKQLSGVTSDKMKYPTNKIKINRLEKELNSKHAIHPTQKPVALMEYLIKTYTNEGELVLDFTCGSGSTLVGCLNTNRRGIGIELDEKYFKIAKERIESTKAQGSLF